MSLKKYEMARILLTLTGEFEKNVFFFHFANAIPSLLIIINIILCSFLRRQSSLTLLVIRKFNLCVHCLTKYLLKLIIIAISITACYLFLIIYWTLNCIWHGPYFSHNFILPFRLFIMNSLAITSHINLFIFKLKILF